MRRTSDESTNGAVAAERHHGQPERRRQQDGGREPGDARRHDPDPAGRPALPAEPGRLRRGLGAESALGPQHPADRDEGDDRDEDRQLRLHQRRDDREDRGPLAARLPQLPDRQQQEHRPEAVDLAPDHRVEPGDRVHDHHRAGDRRPPLADAEVAGHPVDDVAERDVGEDRRQLDQVADAAEELADDAHQPQRDTGSPACSRRRSRGRRSRTVPGRRGWTPRTGTARGPTRTRIPGVRRTHMP